MCDLWPKPSGVRLNGSDVKMNHHANARANDHLDPHLMVLLLPYSKRNKGAELENVQRRKIRGILWVPVRNLQLL
jgi:hypothetical protein